MKQSLLCVFIVTFLLICSTGLTDPEVWKTYKSEAYGFSMLVPENVKTEEKEWSGGWGGLYIHSEDTELYGVAKLGVYAEPDDIEDFAVQLTKIPEKEWKVIDQGKNSNGWKWYKTARTTHGNKIVFGGYGTGPKGSYLLILVTTKEDFEEHKADYDTWYKSVRVF